jgi:replicative DNA helicase
VSNANQHSRTVLAAIIPARADLLDTALRRLTDAHFPDRTLRGLFRVLERYADTTGGRVADRAAAVEMVGRAGADAGSVAAYAETYDLLAGSTVDDAAFAWSVEQLRELAAERATGEALTQSMEILTRGAQDEQGEPLRGHADARKHLLTRLAEIDRNLSMQDAPEGDMRVEGDSILADYVARRDARRKGRTPGCEFGIEELDKRTGGVQPGELALIAAYSSEGKSSLCVNMAWHNTVRGRNVVVLTTETVRDQVRRRIIARHSCLPQWGLEEGINSRSLKDGTLHPELEDVLARVVRDFSTNAGYGRCYIAQVPRGATMGYIESKLSRLARLFTPDLVVMDYLALLNPDRRRASVREELSGILKDAKQLATTYNDGRGVAFASPWQMSRAARLEAEKTGSYTSAAPAETAEATNSPDIVLSLLAPLDNAQRYAKVKAQVMKHRDGERLKGIDLMLDYATCRFTAGDRLPGQGRSELDTQMGLL